MAATLQNGSHTNPILYGHTDPTLVHKCAKTQPIAISTSHVIAKDVPPKLNIYAMYLTSIYRECMCVYAPHVKSLASIM